MGEIIINESVYKIHPVYDMYAANENGTIAQINYKVPVKGHRHRTDYLWWRLRKSDQFDQKFYYIHRFVYECFNGLIPDGMFIGHINGIKDDNRLCNLKLITKQKNQQNREKTQK